MKTCPACHGEVGETVTRGPLRVTLGPLAVYWHGRKFPLTPTQTKMLFILAQRGFATRFALSMVIGQDTADTVIQVHITKMRPRLPRGLSVIGHRSGGWSLQIEGMPMTAKEKIAAQVAALPDDVAGVVLVAKLRDGKPIVAFADADLPGMIRLFAAGILTLGDNMRPLQNGTNN